MLCPFCNTARLDNIAPCPYCGAPSPLQGKTNAGMGLGSPEMWQNPFPQMPFSQAQPPENAPFSPAQAMDEQQRQSMLPALYQQPWGTMPQAGQALIPAQEQHIGDVQASLPGAENMTYIAPMYTKPRAIIPRYRAISGLLSVLIVGLLFCGGLSYYAKTSGKLNAFAQMAGFVPPPNLKPTVTLPLSVPGTPQVTGPAYTIINSATTTDRLNNQHVAVDQNNVFSPGQMIYLTYSVQRPKTPGIVTIKWYTNGVFYQESQTQLISVAINGFTTEQFSAPLEGKVELYWNNVLAITLLFVVK